MTFIDHIVGKILPRVAATNINMDDYTDQDKYDYDYLIDLQKNMMKAVLEFTGHSEPNGLDRWYYKLCMDQWYRWYD